MRSIFSIRCILMVLFLANRGAAQPAVEYLEPASVQRGQSNRIAVAGQHVDRVVDVWTSLPPGKYKLASVISSTASRSELQVDVADDCPLGIYGMRLATEDGLSNCLLFLVDDLPPRTIEKQTTLTLPVAAAGVFREGELDCYTIQVKAGEQVSFDVIASRLGTDADPLITIYDSHGKRLLRRDNNPGLFFDCCFEHTFEREGSYTVEVRDARYLGSTAWRYILRMGKFPTAHVSLPSAVVPGQTTSLKFPELPNMEMPCAIANTQPLGGFNFSWRRPQDNASNWVPLLATNTPSVVEQEPNNTVETATPLASLPVFAQGVLNEAGDKDLFTYELKKGDKLSLRTLTKQLQSAADVELSVLDAAGKELQRADDIALPSGALEDASLIFNANQDGKYYFLIREMTGAYGPDLTYRLEIQRSQPRVQLSTDMAASAIPQGSYQSLPLSLIRTDYNGPLELQLLDAPPGVRLEPTQIPEGENLVLCKLFASGDAPLGIHSFTIAAKGQAGETVVEANVIFQPQIDKQIVNADLLKYALRENQRWLPSSVHSRGALQIMPAIPCEIEPEQSLVMLPRYHLAPLKLQTKRVSGFDGVISFSATGGQLGEESQGRRQVFARFPLATKSDDAITATFHSRTQAQEAKERIDIVAQMQQGERHISLTRSIILQVKPAFEIEVTPPQATLLPGETVTLKLTATRLPAFTEEISIKPTTNMGLELPESLTIASTAENVELSIAIPLDYKPRRDRIRFTATGLVNGFQEEPRSREFDLEVKAATNPAVKK